MPSVFEWVGFVAGGLYILEFLAVRVVGPLRTRLRGRVHGFGAFRRIGGAIIVLAAIALAFANGEGLKFGLAAITVVGLAAVNVAEYRAWRSSGKVDQPSSAPTAAPARDTAPAPETAPAADDRVFIDRTPEELWEPFANLTDLQANTVIAPYIGKWMTHSGAINSIGGWTGYFSQVTFKRVSLRSVFMMFRDKGLLDRLATLKNGDRVSVRGRIDRIDRISIQLEDCEFVDGGGGGALASPAPLGPPETPPYY